MNTVLLDTSVWRKYFSGRMPVHTASVMAELLDQDDVVLCHSAVIGELVLGGLSPREESLLLRLPVSPEVASTDLLEFVRARKLTRRGIGWVDCHLLASAVLADARLWTEDRSLAQAAARVGIAFDEKTT